MATVATLVAKLEADVRDFERGIGKAERRLDELEGSTQSASTATTGLGGKFGGMAGKAAIAGAAIAGVAAVGYDLVSSFSDLEESINAVNVQFGEGASTILDFGETAAESVGMSNSAFNQMAVVTGATLSAFIEDEKAVADETIRLTERAADMASVFNTDVDEAMVALQAALRGEMEPIRRFGVALDDATIKARAVEMGLAATTSEVTMQQKRVAALELIYEQTNKTAGDFANTSDSIANRQRVLGARFEDTKAALGEALVPAMEAFLTLLEKAIPLIETFANVLGGLATFIGGTYKGRIESASRSIEAMNELIAEGASESEAWEQVMGGRFTPTAEDVESALDNVATAAAAAAREERFMTSDALHAADGQRILASAADDSAEAIDNETQSLKDLGAEMAAQADPAINLIRRTQDYEQALTDLQTAQGDTETSAAELEEKQLAVVEAFGALVGAKGEVFDALGTNTAAFEEMARKAGLSDDVIADLIARLFEIPTDIDISIDGWVNISGDTGLLDDLIAGGGGGHVVIDTGGGTPIIGFHEGGVVPGPIGAPQLAVVHGGEQIANPYNPSAMQFDTGGVTIVFEGPTMGNQEIERAVRKAISDSSRRGGRG